MNTTKIFAENKEFGRVSIKIDAEDKHLVDNKYVIVKMWKSTNQSPIITVREPGATPSEYMHLSRLILDSHDMLDENKNVYYKNGDHFDLTKKNLLLGKKFI